MKKLAVQMDDLARLRLEVDSTIRLILEARKRGYQIFHYTPKDLSFQQGEIIATAKEVVSGEIALAEQSPINLKEMDVILIRQDPPFDMEYLTTTYLLEKIADDVLIVNNPKEIRNAPEKLFVLDFPSLIPPTIITSNLVEISQFLIDHQDIVIKPIYSYGGNDVFRIKQGDANLETIVNIMQRMHQNQLIIQPFLPEVKKGDKRVLLADGKPIGAVNRVPKDGAFRSNMVVGGVPDKVILNDRDLEICATIAPELHRRGLVIVGIDIIGRYLTEINVTSPTGIVAVNKLDGTCTEALFWDAIEQKLELGT